MKDFFGRELLIGDTVALLERSGSSSVYIRKGTVIGFTPTKVRVSFVPQGITRVQESTRESYNLIKR